MSRKSDVIVQEKETAMKRRKISGSEWSAEINDDQEKNNDVITYVQQEESLWAGLPGRRSFCGFNKVVEKQYAAAVELKKGDRQVKSKCDTIDDEEMGDRFAELVGLPRGPNQVRIRLN